MNNGEEVNRPLSNVFRRADATIRGVGPKRFSSPRSVRTEFSSRPIAAGGCNRGGRITGE